MIYPFENAAQEEVEAQEEVYIPKEYGINFETGQLSGRVVEGLEAVKVWAWLALQTARQRYYIYSTDYGQEYEGPNRKKLQQGICRHGVEAHDRGVSFD